MKIWFLLACAFLINVAAQAQETPGKASISGVITDSLKNEPVAFVTVSLRESGKTEVLKNTYSQENGRFSFSGLAPKPYELLISFVGFQPKTVKVEGLSANNLNLKLPAIKLQS